jgi:glyoxylase-like metal-dependent hydrolase (beta-lactamase superfamily II)
VISVRTFPVAVFPYPTEYGLAGAARSPAPYVMMRNATQLVQVEDDSGRLINILVNPTDAERSLEAPFFARQVERYGTFVTQKVLSRRYPGAAHALAEVGVAPEEIDFITFDHLHTQDVRGLLGTTEPEPGKSEPTRAAFPNAVLLVQRAELRTLEFLHPLQARWYVRDGARAVPRERIAVLDGDYQVGRGFAMVRTPGHTEGNHSLVIHTDRGLWTVSENGVAVECYAPLSSEIGGVRRHARETESEFILNSNTRENSLDQYVSMALEKTLADPSAERPEFPQCFPSSEMVRSRLAPGLRPTFSHGAITWGEVRSRVRQRPDRSASSAA